jgi:hypothetical protein
LALATWGVGSLGVLSYRTLVGRLADDIKINQPQTTKDVADRWAATVWKEWNAAYKAELAKVQLLHVNKRTTDEEKESARLRGLGVGFCIAGYCERDARQMGAYEILFDPRTPMKAPPVPQPLQIGNPAFWGVPNMIKRLLLGIDERLKNDMHRGSALKLVEERIARSICPCPLVPLSNRAILKRAVHAALEQREYALDSVGGDDFAIGAAPNVFLCAMVHGIMPRKWLAHKTIHIGVSHDARTEDGESFSRNDQRTAGPAREDHETLIQIIELGGDAVGGADPVLVRSEKRWWIDLVEGTTPLPLERQPARFLIPHRDRVAREAPAVAQPVEKSRRKRGLRLVFVKLQIGFGQHLAPSVVGALVEKCFVAAAEQVFEFGKNLRTILLHRGERRGLDELRPNCLIHRDVEKRGDTSHFI